MAIHANKNLPVFHKNWKKFFAAGRSWDSMWDKCTCAQLLEKSVLKILGAEIVMIVFGEQFDLWVNLP